MTTTPHISTASACVETAGRFARPARRGPLSRLLSLLTLRRQRLRLGRLDPHLLDDIGLSREDALHEAERPFWDVPPNWRA